MERPSPWAPHDWEIDRTHRRNAAATLRIHNSLHSVQRGVISLVCAIFGVSCTFFGQMLPEFTAKPIVKPEIHPESPFSPSNTTENARIRETAPVQSGVNLGCLAFADQRHWRAG